jgi:hypothetical protein
MVRPISDVELATYRAHVIEGIPMRQLARDQSLHVSTILRRIRRVEERTDCPLLENVVLQPKVTPMNEEEVQRKALVVLRRLSEPEAVLLYSTMNGMKKSVVVRPDGGGKFDRLCTVDRDYVEEFAKLGWIEMISGSQAQKAYKYRISTLGRSAVASIIARKSGKARNKFDNETAAERLSRKINPCTGQPNLTAEQTATATTLYNIWHGDKGGEEKVYAILRDFEPSIHTLIINCCCKYVGIEETERRLGWSARSGKVVLSIFLDRVAPVLAEHEKAA